MEKISILISGTGSMGDAFAKAVIKQKDMQLINLAFTGEDVQERNWYPVEDLGLGKTRNEVTLITPDNFEFGIEQVRHHNYPNVIAVEFAQPGTNNTPLFAKYNVPWVSGTTGVKKEELAGCGVYDVNMAPSLVAIGNALSNLSQIPLYRNYLSGFKGWFAESHQLYKADPSGTRKKWNEALQEMGAELDMILPERLEPEGHGYHKVNMHHSKFNGRPLILWASILEYAAQKFKEPFAGFDFSAKFTANDNALTICRALRENGDNLGARGIAAPSTVDKKETKDAELANVYFILGGNDAQINFYWNAHDKRGTNAGFETKVNGRGLYQPGIIVAVRHQYERFYVKGQREGIDSMMDVLKK